MTKTFKSLIVLIVLVVALNVVQLKFIYDMKTENYALDEEISDLDVENKNLVKQIKEKDALIGDLEKGEANVSEINKKIELLETEKEEWLIKEEEYIKKEVVYQNKIAELAEQIETNSPLPSNEIPQQGKGDDTTSSDKVAYLTFDDGPSKNTVAILDILKENNVKATFFVLGNQIESNNIYKRIVAEGHSIGNHTYSHDYKTIYSSEEAFWTDFERAEKSIKNTTGFTTKIVRFPGGSNNSSSTKYGANGLMEDLRTQMKQKGYVYFDWNIDSADSTEKLVSEDKIIQTVLDTKNKKVINVLMHDSSPKTTTADALPEIIEGLKKQGYTFKAISTSTSPIQFK